jgi:HEAT repeat protein/beta-lactamase regulating signal transducer with metallopeptidase domain
MRHFIDTFGEPALWFAADWSLRWAALLAVVALLLWIFRPRRAANRELVLKAALIAGLLIPFAPRWGDGWEWHQLQEPSPTSSFPRSAWERTPGRSASRPSPEPDATQSVAPVRSHAERGNEGQPPSEPLGSRRLIVLGIASCWSFVVAYQLIRQLCGSFFLRRLRRESIEATGATPDLFAACRAALHMGNSVRLATHPHIRSPILLGWLRPRIIVPPDWPQQSAESQRAGLLHELAHVHRHDHLLAPLLEMVRIAFFFHPLVRWLLARLEHERELLCDEMVVRLGIDRRAYARLLLEYARSSGRLAWPAVSLPMSRRRTVKGRIHHLLEEDMERWIRPLPARWAVVLGCGLLVLSLGLASYRVWAEEKGKAEASAEKGEQQPAPNKESESIKREDLHYGGKDFYQWRRELLTELKPAIRADGMKAFAAFGANGYAPEATQAILEMMRSYDPQIENNPQEEDAPVVNAGFMAIHKIGAAAAPTLAAAVTDENRNVRRFALVALRRMRGDAKPALPSLLQVFKNTDPMTRSLAIGTVGQCGRGNKEAVAALIEALKDNIADLRIDAADALGWMDESAKPAIPALSNALSDKDTRVRASAIGALRSIGAGAKAVRAVSRLLQDENDTVRNTAFKYLLDLKPEEAKEAVPALIAALKDPSSNVLGIIHLLGRIGPPAKDAIPELTQLLRSDDPNMRESAMSALLKIGPDAKR